MKYPVIYEGKEIIVEAESPEEAAAKAALAPGTAPREVVPSAETPSGVPRKIRSFVESQSWPIRAAIEAAPSTLGYLGGSALPGGPITGALAGTGLEALAQKAGITPESRLALGAAALPAAAKPLGYAGQLGKRLLGASFLRFPGVRTAGSIVEGEASEALAKAALSKLSQRQAVQQAYEELHKRGDLLLNPAEDFAATAAAIKEIREGLKGLSLPMAQRVNTLISQMSKSLGLREKAPHESVPGLMDALGNPVTSPKESAAIRIDRALKVRSELGAIMRQLERTGNMPLGSAKRLYGAMFDDLEGLAGKSGLTGETAKLALDAAAMAKREFAVEKLGQAVSGAEHVIKGKGAETSFDPAQVLEKIIKWTDPKSKIYDKNFAVGLAKELPEIRRWLTEANKKLTPTVGAQGGLVVASRMASAGQKITGATIGAVTGGLTQGGPIGAGVGALIGANAQSVIADLMLTPGGRKILDKAINAGKGRINERFIGALIQGLGQGTIQIGRGGSAFLGETIPRLFQEPNRGD